MQAIRTTFHGATNTRGARVTARAESGRSLTVSYSYGQDGPANHARAVRDLVRKLEWTGNWTGGTFGGSMYWVCSGSSQVVTIDGEAA
jgi:uncharacterized protein YjlB